MKDFTKAERVAVKYLVEWGRFGEVDFPDSVVASYFDLLSGNQDAQEKAIKNLCNHVKGVLGEEKAKEVEQELLNSISCQEEL